MTKLKRTRQCAQCAGLFLLLLSLLINAPPAQMQSPGVYAIRDAQIVVSPGKTIPKGTIVIRDGLIVDVGDAARIPADARIIDGKGLTVYPGLIDAYTNLGLAQPQQQEQQGQRGRGQGQAAQLSPEAQRSLAAAALGDPSNSVADDIRPGGTAIEDARAAGVTSALTSPRQGIFLGRSALVNLSGEDAARMVVRAPVALTIQFSTTSGFLGGFPNSLMGTVSYIRQSFYDAIRYRDEMDRYEKVKRGVPRPEHNKKLAALLPALRGELPVLFNANSEGDIRRALNIADEFRLKPMITGALYGYRVADLLKQKNVPVILSVNFPRRPADMSDDDEEPLRVLRQRAEIPKGAARLAQSGVRFAFTAGGASPRDFMANIRRAIENGLSKEDALRALTVNAAEILGASEQLGTVETGKIANLVLTSGDLFARETSIKHVFVDGHHFEIKRPETPDPARGGPRPAAVNPVGAWDLNIQTPQGEISVKVTITRDGDQLAGTMTSPMGTVTLKSVTISGNQLRATASIPAGGDNIEGTIVGTIEGDSIRGTMSLGAMGSFEFTGSRPR
ncbi:MAG: amidohydrolase family protein [Acidobacteriota bacterium]